MITPLGFTKLIVNDLEKSFAFYSRVFGLSLVDHLQGEIGGEPFDEMILGVKGEYGGGVILVQFTERPAAQPGEVILGFQTEDIDALFEAALAAGGAIHTPAKQAEGTPYKVGFFADPEGHLCEIVQTLATTG